MLGAIKRAIGVRAIRSSFNSAFERTISLPETLQKDIALNVKNKVLATLTDDPFVLEQKLITLNQQAQFSRQTIVQTGQATNQSDPHWLETCLIESIALSGLSGDKTLSDHVMRTISLWIKRLAI
jgi:hypothetical protein